MRIIVIVTFFLACSATTAFDLRAIKPVQHGLIIPVVENVGRIANGHNAAVGQFPYQVGLSSPVNALALSWCGGSLIGHNWVLTAAHCTDGVKSVTVFLGATIRTRAQVQFTVKNNDIIIHPDWDADALRNDISLIRIPTVSYTSLIQPVKLPALARSYSTYSGEDAIASGWGRLGDSGDSVASDLQWADMRIVSNSVCVMKYGFGNVTASNICVSTSNGASTCKGDSGGPLVLESTNVQVGLTSFGAAVGCEKGIPVVFTRLTSYLNWIGSITGISY